MIGNPFTDGVVLWNSDWNRRGVLQIVYLDSSSKVKLQNLDSFITTFIWDQQIENTLIILYNKQLQILASHDEQIPSVKVLMLKNQSSFLGS